MSRRDVNMVTHTAGGKIGRALSGNRCHEGAKSDNDGLHLGVDVVKISNWCSVDGEMAVSEDKLGDCVCSVKKRATIQNVRESNLAIQEKKRKLEESESRLSMTDGRF